MNRSASPAPTSFNPFMEVGEALTVIRSKLELSVLILSSLSSINDYLHNALRNEE